MYIESRIFWVRYLLYTLYTNVLPKSEETKLPKFVDDTKILAVGKTEIEEKAMNKLQNAVNNINQIKWE